MTRYLEPEAGEWILPKQTGFKHACCDCGLVHRIDFRIENGRVEFRVWPAPRETGQVRRHMRAALKEQPRISPETRERVEREMKDDLWARLGREDDTRG